MFSLDAKVIDDVLATTVPSFQLTSRETANLGFGFIFYGLTRAIRPRHVVVVGSKAGFAPVCFALGIRDNEGFGIDVVDCESTTMTDTSKTGLLTFIDPSLSIHRGDAGHSFGIGTWDEPETTAAIFANHGVGAIVRHYKMTSADYIADSPPAPPIDILYIDGDHSYEGVSHDLTSFAPLLSETAIILAHDVHPGLPDSDGYRAFADLPGTFEKIRLPFTPGLAIIRQCDR